MIGIERLNTQDEIDSLKKLIQTHFKVTASPHAQALVENWEKTVSKLWKVVPHPPKADFPKPFYTYDAAKMPIGV